MNRRSGLPTSAHPNSGHGAAQLPLLPELTQVTRLPDAAKPAAAAIRTQHTVHPRVALILVALLDGPVSLAKLQHLGNFGAALELFDTLHGIGLAPDCYMINLPGEEVPPLHDVVIAVTTADKRNIKRRLERMEVIHG